MLGLGSVWVEIRIDTSRNDRTSTGASSRVPRPGGVHQHAHRAPGPRGPGSLAYINGDAVVIDGGKMQSGGGGASTQWMLDWTDEQWEAIRPKKK